MNRIFLILQTRNLRLWGPVPQTYEESSFVLFSLYYINYIYTLPYFTLQSSQTANYVLSFVSIIFHLLKSNILETCIHFLGRNVKIMKKMTKSTWKRKKKINRQLILWVYSLFSKAQTSYWEINLEKWQWVF